MAKERPDLEVIGRYEGYSKPIKLRCRICGEEYEARAGYAARKLCPNVKNHAGYKFQEQF